MEKISIKASPKQIARLRNGHKVRIAKPFVEGEGFNLLVNPANFSHISRTFARGKGTTLQLSPEELMASQGVEGKGIFSDLRKSGAKAVAGVKSTAKGAVADAKKIGRQIKKGAEDAVADVEQGFKTTSRKGRKSVAKVVSKMRGESKGAPETEMGAEVRGGSFLKALKSVGKKVISNPLTKQLAKTGISMVGKEAMAMGADPSLVGAVSSVASKGVDKLGSGMYAGGRGLYAGAPHMRGGAVIPVPKRAVGYLGGRNQLLQAHHTLPPAMISTPYSANFHFSTQFPPALQKL